MFSRRTVRTNEQETNVSGRGGVGFVTNFAHAQSLFAVRSAAVSTLGKLDAATLAQHAPAIVARLDDPDSGVRWAAVRALGQLDAATLTPHAIAIVARLDDPESGVRSAAVRALGKLDAATLAQHRYSYST